MWFALLLQAFAPSLAGEMVDTWDYPPEGVNIRNTPLARIVDLGEVTFIGTVSDQRFEYLVGRSQLESLEIWTIYIDQCLRGPCGERVDVVIDWDYPPSVETGTPVAGVLSPKIQFLSTMYDSTSRLGASGHLPPFSDLMMPTAGGSLLVHTFSVSSGGLAIRALGPTKGVPWAQGDWAQLTQAFIDTAQQ